MTLFMRRLLICCVVFELLLFLLLYYFGPNGMHVLFRLAKEKELVSQEIVAIGHEVETLDQKIKEGRMPFAKEKIARERLHMKKNNETIYFTKG